MRGMMRAGAAEEISAMPLGDDRDIAKTRERKTRPAVSPEPGHPE
jgi:hypothetical protein